MLSMNNSRCENNITVRTHLKLSNADEEFGKQGDIIIFVAYKARQSTT